MNYADLKRDEKPSGRILSGDASNDNDRLILKAEAERIIRRIGQLDPAGVKTTTITVSGWWQGELRWTRNRVSLASDRRDVQVSIQRLVNGHAGTGVTNQTDDESLTGVLRMAERAAELGDGRGLPAFPTRPPQLPTPNTAIWSDATYSVTAETRGELARVLTAVAEEQNLLSAGYLEMRGAATATLAPASATPDTIIYNQMTQAQCSMTVRHPKGIGSGWAGLSSYNWSAIDGPALARIALAKCIASLNPVAIEPGRYTAVLEPQAVSDLVTPLARGPLQNRVLAEGGRGPFALEYDDQLQLWRTKLGLKIMDERITIDHDPLDPLLGVVAEPGLIPTTWVKNGVLTALSYSRVGFALELLNDNLGLERRVAYRMSGGATSVDEMIATTKRGILVTRLSGVDVANENGMLMNGFTRDGLWLIENGKVSKAIKNFRFTESPLFVLNQVEQLGVPVPVFQPVRNPYQIMLSPTIVPPLKVRDFSFTSTVDAV